jgi:hypothetical protein
MILFEKYGQHQPLNRQSERYALEGVDLSLSTLADQVGACAVVLRPLYDLIRADVFAAGRVHGDDTPVPVLAKGQDQDGAALDPGRGGVGPMSATIAHSVGRTRRPRSSSIRRIAPASTPNAISKASPVSCRPMPMLGSTASSSRIASPVR